ncbi:molecular chaperone TorD family protein [Paradesulfitobacterium aromaticivorans]
MIEREETAGDRARAFEFLAGIFLKEPSMAAFNEVRIWAAEGKDPEILSLLQEINNQDPGLTELTQEYYDLFFVPVSGRFVPPFEAAIVGAMRQEGRQTKFGAYWGEQTIKLASLYEQTRFHPGELEVFEPLRGLNLPDHIGFELAYMAYLIRLEGKQGANGLSVKMIKKLEVQFLNEHLRVWLPLLVEDLRAVPQSGYYPYFAQLARDFCREEAGVIT